tara:strand:+ start:3612 stop:4397 length:786 start_codon:yes stop_codon:yes gene_type:complete
MPSFTNYHDVLINLAAQSDFGSDWTTNRIALKAENVSVSTTKNVLATPLPFTGIIFGEAQTVALDWGNSAKNISLSGIITDQIIKKKFSKEVTKTVTMTAQEVAQLIHASVDSSFMQKYQNINSIIVLIPSRVDKNYNYHGSCSISVDADGEPILPMTEVNCTGAGGTWTALTEESTSPDSCPQIPFTYKVRGGYNNKQFDATQVSGIGGQTGDWPDIVSETVNPGHLPGFVRSFNTTLVGGQPFVEFSLDFEVATNPMTD